MPINFYPRLSLTGGVAGSLDNLDGTDLQDLDISMVGELGVDAKFYVLDADSGVAESSPNIIAPDLNPGTKRWILLGANVKSLTTDYVQFDTAYADGSVEGRMQWNSDDGTMEYGLPGGNVTLQVGQEHVIKVRNTTGATILNGKPVYFSGSAANRPLVALADASDHAKSHVEGVATEDIAHNANGYITLEGLVRDVNTNHLTEGADVWLDPASPGLTTSTRPTAPNAIVLIGHCVIKNATTGVLLIHANALMTMMEGSDVLYDATPAANEILAWNAGNSRFELTLTPTFTTVDVGTDFTVGSLVITNGVITDGTGLQLAANVDITGNLDINGALTFDGVGAAITAFQTAITNSDVHVPTGGAVFDYVAAALAAVHPEAHTITSHTDVVDATGAQLETLTGTGDADSLHTHALKANLAGPTFTGTVTVPATNFTVGTQILTAANLTDLLDGGDTTLHDHDGISENTSARHTQGTDTTLGTMTADINMNSLYQVVNLQAPAASGEAIRQTANVTEANLNTLTGGGDTTLHDHDGISENTTHRSSNGSDHSYLDQAVTIAGTPTFGTVDVTSNFTVGGLVITNNALTSSSLISIPGTNGIGLGTGGSAAGLLAMYAEAVSTGPQIDMYTADDSDTIIELYQILVTGEDLQIGPNTDGDSLKYTRVGDLWTFSGTGVAITSALAAGTIDTTGANEWTASQNFNEAAITSSAAATAWNAATAQTALHTLTENTTISAPSNLKAGAHYTLRVVQAAGVYTLAFNAVFKWGTATAPTAPAANGDVIILSFYSDGTTMYGIEAVRVEA